MNDSTLIGPAVNLRHGRVRPPSSHPPLVVQKYGGTLLRSDEGREAVVEQIRRTHATGRRIVVVASAMGRAGEPYATDTLLGLASCIDTSIDPRIQDLLASCGEVISTALIAHLLNHSGFRSVALTGRDAGIITDDHFGDASIICVQPLRVLRALRASQIPVVAGFQGRTSAGDVTTLGRGGSDTSAVALAAAAVAAEVEIFKDVDGMFTADPRVVPTARPIAQMSYADAACAGWLGARVLHPRAAEIARTQCVPLRIRPLLSCPESGTDIGAEARNGGAIVVVNTACPAPEAQTAHSCARVSVVGSGLAEFPDVPVRGTRALHAAGVSEFGVEEDAATSAFSWRVPLEAMEAATRALHHAFVEECPQRVDSLLTLRVA